ncbi:MAG: LysR family transcriptional regulator [Deltaproteobacteria bacterium]|nr:LysR family transcriptional regulator [Deltaproteobacteria bacterium]
MSLLHPGLEAFMAVIRHSTVHGAAREIGLTQTGVTQRIRALERQLGTTLFTRSRKGMHPTPEGEALHRYCQSARDLEGQLLSFLHNKSDEATVRINICGPSSIMRSRIIPGAVRIISAHPNVTFTFNLNDDESSLKQLKSGEAQLAVLSRSEVVNELDSKLLAPSSYILVGPASWHERDIEDIVSTERIVDFNASDKATFKFLKKFGLFEKCIRERHLANNIDALASLIAKGLGYSVLTRKFAEPLFRAKQVIDLMEGNQLELEFALAWYPRHEMPPYFAKLIKYIK